MTGLQRMRMNPMMIMNYREQDNELARKISEAIVHQLRERQIGDDLETGILTWALMKVHAEQRFPPSSFRRILEMTADEYEKIWKNLT